MDFTPVAGDTAGNNLKWDSMKIEADMYLKTGNYSLLRDVRMRQARFTELWERAYRHILLLHGVLCGPEWF